MKSTGSEVGEVLNNDHAQAGQLFLEHNGYAKEWQVVVADDRMLMLDYDQREWDGALPEHFYTVLGIFDAVVGHNNHFCASPSKGGNTHCVVHFESPMPIAERIAWQAAFGSDPKREALHLLSVSRDELNPILLFMRKPAEQFLLGDGNVTT
jgi:hypothetical protein